MSLFSNIWQHPRTSAAGVLIAVVTIAGVFSQQGVGLGSVGTGSAVSLVSALATALLGLLARDPGPTPPASAGGTAKLGAWALIALLLPLPFLGGCTANSVAQNIVDWTPPLESAVAAVDSTASLLSPRDESVFQTATSGFDAAASLLATQARVYLANPSAATLAQMQSQVVVFQQQVNTALLQAARIVDSASQQHAMSTLQAVATIVSAILALVQSVSSKAQVARMASQSSIKLAAVQPYLSQAQAARVVAAQYGEPVAVARRQVAQAEQMEMQAGF